MGDRFTRVLFDFNYTGHVERIVLPKGSYLFEVYGAEGGGGLAGKGGYSSGNLTIEHNTKLYIYVGGKGGVTAGGYNGGGEGGKQAKGTSYGDGGGGGGSSDVRLEEYNINSRVIVSGGGGGTCGNSWSCGGNGGGLIGGPTCKRYSIPIIYGGNQTWRFPFQGQSSSQDLNAGSSTGEGNGGGGGGYYGGMTNININLAFSNSGGSGGSSYISGYPGCTKYSNDFIFKNGKMLQGVKQGNGRVIIKGTAFNSTLRSRSFCMIVLRFSAAVCHTT